MGTFWNKGVYTLQIPGLVGKQNGVSLPALQWVHEKTIDIVPIQRKPPAAPKLENNGEPAQITAIPRLKLETADDFLKVVRDGKPVVLESLDLGSCISAWTLDYLVSKVGVDRKVGYPFLLHVHVLLTLTDRHPRGSDQGDGLYGQKLPLRHR
jgi:tRNA wybutosine-synthesizing protein 4